MNSGNALLFVITADYSEVCGDLITFYCEGRYIVLQIKISFPRQARKTLQLGQSWHFNLKLKHESNKH